MPCSLTCALLVFGSGRALPFFRDFIVNFVLGNEEGMIWPADAGKTAGTAPVRVFLTFLCCSWLYLHVLVSLCLTTPKLLYSLETENKSIYTTLWTPFGN